MTINHLIHDEQGSMIVYALMILALLTIIGLSASNNSVIEVQTATNDMMHKIAFYEAEGGAQIGSLMLEENIACAQGFVAASHQAGGAIAGTQLSLGVEDPALWMIQKGTGYDPYTFDPAANRVLRYPQDDTVPHTNIAMVGVGGLNPGSALQILAGYEGKGKGLAGGGGFLLHDIHSQHIGSRNSESIIKIQWLHLVGQEGTCRY